MISIFNLPKEISISQNILEKSLEEVISSQFKLQNISIIFVSEKEIRKLNNEYRKIDEVTDVLSFSFNSKEILGEVYVCSEYIQRNYDISEVYRVIIHGILHLYGYDHLKEFVDIKSENIENIFVIQESILDKLIKKL